MASLSSISASFLGLAVKIGDKPIGMPASILSRTANTLALLMLALSGGCQGGDDWFGGPAPANVVLRTAPSAAVVAGPSDWSRIAVPAADGPRLAPLAVSVPVRLRPERSADVIGSLRVGARVARSAEPVSRRECPAGWYAVRPVGFVCAGSDSTIDLTHPIARAIQVEPERTRPMPYRYGFIRAIAPNYLRVPSKDEQFRSEMRLERHLRSWKKLKDAWDDLEVGANDVPLDGSGLAIGAIPTQARPLGESERFGGNGDERVPWWLIGERRIPNISTFRGPPSAVMADRIKRHAGVAMIGAFVASDAGHERRFAITTDARLIPADKIRPNSGSPFHGLDIRDVGLPVAFAYGDKRPSFRLKDGHLEPGPELGLREFLQLTGSVKELRGDRMVEVRDGRWVKSDDLRTAARPSKLPAWATKKNRWVDVSLINQTLVLWEGDKPVYATLVSTGRDGLGDPAKTFSTPQGFFKIFQKHVTTTMDSTAAESEFELRDVPWVMYFKGGYALHAAYWHDDFGRPRSHGCINLAPIDARHVFEFVSPAVPDHWHMTSGGNGFEEGSIVYTHP